MAMCVADNDKIISESDVDEKDDGDDSTQDAVEADSFPRRGGRVAIGLSRVSRLSRWFGCRPTSGVTGLQWALPQRHEAL